MQSAWEPLEGTPRTLNTLAQKLGLDTKKFHFVDVLGLEEEVLAVTIPPSARCAALILLYPTTDPDIDTFLAKAGEKQSAKDNNQSCVFLKQILGGTCGTLAVVHAIANTFACRSAIAVDSAFSQLIHKRAESSSDSVDEPNVTKEMSCWFVGLDLVRQAHQSAVDAMQKGKKNAPSLSGQRQGRHFMTWVHRDGYLWELNGRREGPACRGWTNQDTFLKDTISIVRDIFAVTRDESVYAKSSLLALISTG